MNAFQLECFCGTCGSMLKASNVVPALCPTCLDVVRVSLQTDLFALRVSELEIPTGLLARVQAIRARAERRKIIA